MLLTLLLVFSHFCLAQQENIQDILSKAKDIGSVKYEIVITNSMAGLGQETPRTMTMNVWQKYPNMRFESTTAATPTKMIVRSDAVYFYDGSRDKYIKMSAGQMVTGAKQKTLEELTEEIKESKTLKVLGTETIDGKLTTIAEVSFTSGGFPITEKLWIWNEKGIPLRTEITMKMGENVTTTNTEYRNFVFGDIPDSLFEVPSDKIIE
jgi:outer membrane lipoprotein-sorting protein